MYTYLKRMTLLLAIPALMMACTEEPANDPGTDSTPANDARVNDGSPSNKDFGLGSNPIFKNFADMISTSPDAFSYPGEIDGVGSEEEQQLKLENIRKPIVYGVGAGGITMDTTFEESKTLLTPPFRGPFENGATLYNEQLYVVWKQEGDRKPQIIIPIGGYLGEMDGGKFGQLNFQTKFLSYKPDEAEGAARLTRDLYLELEQVEDKSYNCLVTGRCRMIYGGDAQANFVMVLPGAIFLMAKEEFQIAEIRIVRDIDPGMLANNLDLLTGDVLVPNQAPFKLGQTHKEIFDRINASPVKSSPEVYIQTDSLVYAWNGVYLVFHRTNYGVEVLEAESSDQTMAVQVTPEYPAYLTLSGRRILMTQTPDDISFALEEALVDPELAAMDVINLSATEVEYKMTMNTKVRKQDSILFAEKFAKFLADQLSGEFDQVRYRVWGIQNEQKLNRRVSVALSAFQEDTLKGVDIGFQVNEEQEKLEYTQVSLIEPEMAPFLKVTLPASIDGVTRKETMQPVLNQITGDPIIDIITKQPTMELRKSDTFTELAGIKLNDVVKLEDIDALGRGEATVTFMSGDQSLGTIKERAGYTDKGVFMYPENNRPTPRQQGFVSVAGASLGIQVVQPTNAQGEPVAVEPGVQYARVVSITAGSMFGMIQDVCGIDRSLGMKIGMKDYDVVSKLQQHIQSKEGVDASYACDHFQIRDDGSLGILNEIYFPEERMKMVFDDRALTAVTIYMPLSEVEPLVLATGGNQ